MRISDWSSDVCSSDLEVVQAVGDSATAPWIGQRDVALFTLLYGCGLRIAEALSLRRREAPGADGADALTVRSEEHTSELQSLMRISYAVFCLKKKKKQKNL